MLTLPDISVKSEKLYTRGIVEKLAGEIRYHFSNIKTFEFPYEILFRNIIVFFYWDNIFERFRLFLILAVYRNKHFCRYLKRQLIELVVGQLPYRSFHSIIVTINEILINR